MVTHYNPSISESPRNQDTPIIRRVTEETILAWLERTGRLMAYEADSTSERVRPPAPLAEQQAQVV